MKLRWSLFGLTFAIAVLSACQTGTPAAPGTPKSAAGPTPVLPAAAESAKPVTSTSARNIAENCFACHGPDGRSPGAIPSLSRLSAERIAARLKDFKTGAEPSTVMARHAKAYSDAEIQAVANYIAALNK